jgi:all-trans-retinol 13,14-reductase
MSRSVIIIGSGLGGLSTGIILAKNGYRVTVLEQDRQVGGCLQCFWRKGAKFETGMHFVGSSAPGQTLQKFLHFLEVDREVTLSPLDADGYEVVDLDGKSYRFATGRRAFVDTFSRQFPQERENLERLCDIVEGVANASSLHSLKHTETDNAINTQYLTRSINEVIDEVIGEPALRAALCGNLPLYAAEKDKTPFSTYAFVMDFYNQSAYRIVGGSDRLAVALVHSLERHGGQVLTQKKVTRICCDAKRATGVDCADGSHYDADIVISDAHPARTIPLVDSPLLRPAYRKRVAQVPNTIGGFAVYVKFKPEAMPYMNHNFYGYRQNTPWDCEKYTSADWPRGFLYMHLCDEEHQKWARSGVILSYMHFADVARWQGTKVGHRGEDYETFKRQHAERLLNVVDSMKPGILKAIEDYWTSTPLTYLCYTGTPEGSMYGVAKDINLGPAGRIHHRTRVPNLLLTGQNINSHGILGVLVGTMVTCGELLTSEKIFNEIVNE